MKLSREALERSKRGFDGGPTTAKKGAPAKVPVGGAAPADDPAQAKPEPIPAPAVGVKSPGVDSRRILWRRRPKDPNP
eukprot:4113393-Alexandrium_andersonii.AAC.1